jgi:hypothetical protein
MLVRQLAADRPQHRETADSRIEDSHRLLVFNHAAARCLLSVRRRHSTLDNRTGGATYRQKTPGNDLEMSAV